MPGGAAPAKVRGIIVAFGEGRVIGLNGAIPWNYPMDLRRFKRVTTGATVVMGRLTWESMGRKPLPGRRNVVISRTPDASVEVFPSIADALATMREEDVWFIGGARIYEEAMRFADRIDVTLVPETITDPNAVRFPEIDLKVWEPTLDIVHEDDPRLRRRVYERIAR